MPPKTQRPKATRGSGTNEPKRKRQRNQSLGRTLTSGDGADGMQPGDDEKVVSEHSGAAGWLEGHLHGTSVLKEGATFTINTSKTIGAPPKTNQHSTMPSFPPPNAVGTQSAPRVVHIDDATLSSSSAGIPHQPAAPFAYGGDPMPSTLAQPAPSLAHSGNSTPLSSAPHTPPVGVANSHASSTSIAAATYQQVTPFASGEYATPATPAAHASYQPASQTGLASIQSMPGYAAGLWQQPPPSFPLESSSLEGNVPMVCPPGLYPVSTPSGVWVPALIPVFRPDGSHVFSRGWFVYPRPGPNISLCGAPQEQTTAMPAQNHPPAYGPMPTVRSFGGP